MDIGYVQNSFGSLPVNEITDSAHIDECLKNGWWFN